MSTARYEALRNSKVLVITGAGASVPLGMPAMDGFFERLKEEWQKWMAPILESFPEGRKTDMELLLARLTYYEELRGVAQKDGCLTSNAVNLTALSDLVKKSHRLREDIFDEIIRTYGKLSSKASTKAVQLYKDLYFQLVSATRNRPGVLPIFTTNYDLTFEAIEKKVPDFKICTGISRGGDYGVWESSLYEKAQDYDFAIFRLHGCSHWVRSRVGEIREIVFQPLPDRKDLENKEPRILYPVPDKDSRIEEEPFSTAYKYLKLCLAAAKTIVIIGYSGRDAVIQDYLGEALNTDAGKKLVIVTGGKELRPELQKIMERARGAAHLGGGIEANVDRVWKEARGSRLTVSKTTSFKESTSKRSEMTGR